MADAAGEHQNKEHTMTKAELVEEVTRVTSVLAPAQEHDFKILRLEPDQHKISLSFRAAQKQVERQEIEEYRASKPSPKQSPSPMPVPSPKSSPNATIGDAILAKRQSS